MDSLIAALVVFIVLGAAAGYIAKSGNVIVDMQTSRTGSDIVVFLENTNSFDALDSGVIAANLNDALPDIYGMKLNIQCSDEDLNEAADIMVGDSAPYNVFAGAGRRFFIIKNPGINYCVAEYTIWKK